MASSNAHIRRGRKFPPSVLEHSSRADPETPTAATTTTTAIAPTAASQAATNARLATNAPQVSGHPVSRAQLRHLRMRSQSQANLKDDHGGHHHSASLSTPLRARRVVSTTQMSQRPITPTIESLVAKPPASLTESLQDLRYLILTQGVAADTDGNVCLSCAHAAHS